MVIAGGRADNHGLNSHIDLAAPTLAAYACTLRPIGRTGRSQPGRGSRVRSMTGFGAGEGTVGGVTIAVELRSVNHRFLDVALKLPNALAPYEFEIRNLLRERVARGRVTCSAQFLGDLAVGAAGIDQERLEQGLALLQLLADRVERETRRRPTLELSHVLAIPDLFGGAEAGVDQESVLGALRAALEAATTALQIMRDREGAELAAELAGRAARLRSQLAEVERLTPTVARETLDRLNARLTQLVTDGIDPQRLAQEAAILADRASIGEECERLASHLEQFEQTLAETGQVAKRLNFLLQEMHREVNTMGAKTSLLTLTQLVIGMKEEIENLREQVQNLE